MTALQPFIAYLEQLAHQVPLPVFVSVGSVMEEIIAPIPSPIVMTVAGTIASAQQASHLTIFLIALLAALAKTTASIVIYGISYKAENLFTGRFGKLLGLDQKEIEGWGKKLNQGTKDDWILASLRALPFVPTAPVSIVCGLLKINLRTFIISTFMGLIPRNLFYLYLGYYGNDSLMALGNGVDNLEKIGNLVIAGILGVAFAYILYRKYKKPMV